MTISWRWTRSLLARWLLVNLTFTLGVLALRGVQGLHALGLLVTPVFALAFWHPWVLAPAARRPWLLRLFWIAWLSWLGLAAVHEYHLGLLPGHGTLEFLLSEPSYGVLLLKDRLRLWMLPLVAVPVLAGAWLAKGEPGPPRSRTWAWSGLVLVLASLVLFDQKDLSPKGMGPDVTTLRMLVETRLRRLGGGELRRALARVAVPKGPPPAFSILLLVNESLNADGMDPDLMPHLKTLLDRGELLRFPRAYAAASMTDVALPSLFSGLTPAEPSSHFHHEPLLWHHAQAHGMATALFSVQRMNYYGFQDFLLADGLDEWMSADRAGLPLVNDSGGDDALLVPRFRRWLQAHRGRPTFTVLHFNATHVPYLQESGYTPWTAEQAGRLRPEVLPTRREDQARYWNAIRYLDHLQDQLFEVLSQEGTLERTWIISTSDHGEAFLGPSRGRMDDLRPQTLHLPLWMRLPRAFPPAWKRNLALNQARLTSNLDLAPTLAAALGDAPPHGPGLNLLAPLPPGQRAVVADNSGEIRSRKPETAAVIWEQDGTLFTWRWHSEDGTVFERIDGEDGDPIQPTPDQQARVRRELAPYPLVTGLPR